MRADQPETADGAARTAHERLRNSITTHRRSGAVAALVASAAVALAAFTATSSSHAASLKRSSHNAKSSKTDRSHASSATTQGNDNSTGLLDQWAACARSHGDSNQADPTVEHEVIYIATQMELAAPSDPSDIPACSRYLTAARNAVAGGKPATHLGAGGSPAPGWGDDALYVQYANCMRANGYPTFPYPSGRIEPDGNESTDFNGTGIDPMSPAFLNGNANQTCGKQIGAPAWWINSWGPPGSVDVYPAGTNPNSPLPTGPPTLHTKAMTAPGGNGPASVRKQLLSGANHPPVAGG